VLATGAWGVRGHQSSVTSARTAYNSGIMVTS